MQTREPEDGERHTQEREAGHMRQTKLGLAADMCLIHIKQIGHAVPGCVAHLPVGEKSYAFAEFIVRAVNSHDALVSALQRAQTRIKALLSQHPVRDIAETMAEIDAALKSATGEQP